MKPWTFVFDLDGTLVDTAPDLLVALNKALTMSGYNPVPISVLRPAMSYGARRMVELGLAAQPEALQSKDADATHVDQLCDILLDHYKQNVAVESRPYPGVSDLLQRLQKEGHTIAVCTNKSEALAKELLTILGFAPYFAAICGKDTFPVSKPHPDHLTHTIQMAQGQLHRSLMIGDSDVDIKTAQAARIPVIGVAHGYSPLPLHHYGPDVVIDDFSRFFSVAEQLMA